MIPDADLKAIIDTGHQPEENLFSRPAYLKQFAPFLPRKEILVFTGVRRAGKSALMKLLMRQLLKQGVHSESVTYVNLEDYHLADYLTPDLLQQIVDSRLKRKERAYLFLDEVQVVKGWEKWARTIYDNFGEKVKMIVSGSNASLLSKEYSSTLTGRNFSFQIRPLSYSEYLTFGGKQNRTLEDYMQYGGFPEVVLTDSPTIKSTLLQQYFEDIVNKDVINRHALRDARQVYILARFLAANPGQKISFNKLAKTFGSKSTTTILQYAQYLKETFLFSEVPFHSYSIKDRHDVSRLPKYYVCDNGFINILETPSTPGHGKRLENSVYLAIQDKYETTYWGDKHEVDFITNTAAINVTTEQKPLQREVEGLQEFSAHDKHSRRQLILVTPIAHRAPPEIILIKPEDFLKNPKILSQAL